MRTVPKVESDWDLLHQRRIGLDSGLAMARVFWPRLVEVNGFVFLEENYDPEYLERLIHTVDRSKIEATVNTVYLDSLFSQDPEPSDSWPVLGRVVCECWISRASLLFPGREFLAEFQWFSDNADPGVTLQQKKWVALPGAK
jgi:hypothetical protein